MDELNKPALRHSQCWQQPLRHLQLTKWLGHLELELDLRDRFQFSSKTLPSPLNDISEKNNKTTIAALVDFCWSWERLVLVSDEYQYVADGGHIHQLRWHRSYNCVIYLLIFAGSVNIPQCPTRLSEIIDILLIVIYRCGYYVIRYCFFNTISLSILLYIYFL